jgi:hypothetical protein
MHSQLPEVSSGKRGGNEFPLDDAGAVMYVEVDVHVPAIEVAEANETVGNDKHQRFSRSDNRGVPIQVRRRQCTHC